MMSDARKRGEWRPVARDGTGWDKSKKRLPVLETEETWSRPNKPRQRRNAMIGHKGGDHAALDGVRKAGWADGLRGWMRELLN
jgi:hypothetical protein